MHTQAMHAAAQYCPVAVATEILADRWTPLILREFIVGAHTFGEIHSGIPHISRSLLSERLKQLAVHGVVERTEGPGGRPAYRLTPAGEDLEEVVFGLGEWAIRWAYFAEPGDEQLDNAHLMWRFRRGVVRDRVPAQRLVTEFVLSCPAGTTEQYWLVVQPADVEVCLKHPGFDVDVQVRTSSRELHRVWLGRTTFAAAMRAGTLEIAGPPALVRSFPRWFSFSPFVPAVRRASQSTSA
jgi:DNA-binding HxlR family transcriptional regulator